MTRFKCPPFCKPNCNEKHHDLLLAILNIPSENKGARKSDSNGGLEEFESCVQSYLKKGWSKNKVVPDPVADYQFPLVHWASVLGKPKALEWLIKQGFDPTVRAPTTKETALHRCTLCLELSEMFLHRKVLERKVGVLIDLLKDCLILRNRSMDTPLHVAARQLIEGRRKLYLEDCVKLLLAKLKQYFPDQYSDVINAKNSAGDTILHILACSEDAFVALRAVINEGAVTSTINTQGKTPLDIATEKGSMSATALLKRISDERISNQADNPDVDGASSEDEDERNPTEADDPDVDGVTDKAPNDEEKEQSDKTSNVLPELADHDYPVCSCKVKKEACCVEIDISQNDSNNELDLDQNNNLLDVLRAVGLLNNVKELALKKRNEEEKLLASKVDEMQALTDAIGDAEKLVENTKEEISSKEKDLQRIKNQLENMKKELNYMSNEHQELKRRRSSLDDECGQLKKKLNYCDTLLKVQPQEIQEP